MMPGHSHVANNPWREPNHEVCRSHDEACASRNLFRRKIITLSAVAFACLTAAAGSATESRIARGRHGRAPTERAEEYARHLNASIQSFSKTKGNLGFQMMRETVGHETHFLVISYWASRDAVRAFAGDDISLVHPLSRDPEFLIDPKKAVLNYEIVDERRNQAGPACELAFCIGAQRGRTIVLLHLGSISNL